MTQRADLLHFSPSSIADDFLPALRTLQKENARALSEASMKRGMEILLKELQFFPDEIRAKIEVVYPPPPPGEKKVYEKDELDGLSGGCLV